MAEYALASFEAKDGTGRWEVFTWGIIANGQRYHFTKQSHIVCAGLPGRTERHVYQTEEDDDFGLWAALAVYQETGSLTDAGLAAWALGGPSIETHIDTRDPRQRDAFHRALAPWPQRQPFPALPRRRPLGPSRRHPALRRHHPRRHQCLPSNGYPRRTFLVHIGRSGSSNSRSFDVALLARSKILPIPEASSTCLATLPLLS